MNFYFIYLIHSLDAGCFAYDSFVQMGNENHTISRLDFELILRVTHISSS